MNEMAKKLRTQEDVDRFRAALVPVDTAFWQSEQKWGVGRLERLVSTPTLEAYRRGWDQYRVALDDGDAEAVAEVGPKMIAALAFMDAEATGAGYQALAPETWECPMTDGTVLVVVRTNAEASAVIREVNGRSVSGAPGGGLGVTVSTETTLPPDLVVTVRQQHEGRRLEVWTLGEIARLIETRGSVVSVPGKHAMTTGSVWEGNTTQSGVQQSEGVAADLVRQGYPLTAPLSF